MIAGNRGALEVTRTDPLDETPMALSDAAIRAAKPGRQQFKLYDEGGLSLIVKPPGGKLWRLAPHVFVRLGELRQAEWSKFDRDAAVWRIPANRMKMKRKHVVPFRQPLFAQSGLISSDRIRLGSFAKDFDTKPF
jgi:hypothetical protein